MKKEWPLIRFIIPSFPEVNIFSRQAKKTTALGPIMVATVANKIWGWRVEVIDENNYRGPKNRFGLPDHTALQGDDPAVIVAFYCGLTSTMERVWDLASFYHERGVKTIAGGWHVRYMPEEAREKNIDIVVPGDGEIAIKQILAQEKKDFSEGDIVENLNDLPYPDFGLLKHAKLKIYPIGRTRGCKMNCEFCSVKGKPRSASAIHLFKTVKHLVETRNAKKFFIVDDRIEEDLDETITFFKMVSQEYGKRLFFTVQARLETAKNEYLLRLMKDAGVRVACIGYESPIEVDLKTMRKGYSSSQALAWTKVIKKYFRIHGMFMFGYPIPGSKERNVEKDIKCFKKFIRKASLDTIQILHPVPLVGTALRKRLEKRLFPLEVVPWSKYDGSYACFRPEDMSLEEFQQAPLKIMAWFYSPFAFFRVGIRTILFPIDYIARGWSSWFRGWWRDVIKYGGHLLIQKWIRKQKREDFVKKIKAE